MEEWSFLYSSRVDWCVSTPAWLSRSLLQPNTLSIGSGTCVLTEHHSGIGSSQFHILLHLLLDLVAEQGSLGHGWSSHGRV